MPRPIEEMKLVSWNCQGGFRNKANAILQKRPDILVVQECESPEKLKFNDSTPQPNQLYWHGEHVHKGLAVFSYSDYTFELHPDFDPSYRFIIPFNVTGKNHSFLLFAVWAMDCKIDSKASYIGQVWNAVNYYRHLFNKPTVMIGDFNSNKIWDSKRRECNHGAVVNRLKEHDIHSVYHDVFDAEHGEETHPTFFHGRKKILPYHIDYCFSSADLLGMVEKIEIGEFDDWIDKSDHTPISIKFNIS